VNRTYVVVIRFPITHLRYFRLWSPILRGDYFVIERTVEAENRTSAVKKARSFFWSRFVRSGLSPYQCLTVDDPYYEVLYKGESFDCSSIGNNFLTEEVIERIIAESCGILIRDNVITKFGHPLYSLRRTRKNNRPFMKMVAPCIYKSKAGTFYYSITTQPQYSRAGVVVQRGKKKLIRLSSRTLAQAIREIIERRLRNQHCSRRKQKRRSLKLVAHLAGITSLMSDDLDYFAQVLNKKKLVGAL
jgi:hypothetical protein